MFRRSGDGERSPQGARDRVDSILGEALSWKGSVSGAGGLRIDGSFDGDIELNGLVVIGREGRVTCKLIRALTVVISGSVRGDITADRIELLATARVWGDVVTTSLSTEEGAFLRGQIRMEDKLEHDFPERAESEPVDVEAQAETERGEDGEESPE